MRILLPIVVLLGLVIGFFVPLRPASREQPAPSAAARAPAAPPSPSLRATDVVVERSPNGHFLTVAEVNGRPISFVVDTGASVVALTQEAARTAGVGFDPARFQDIGHGAGGNVRGQAVTLNRLELGGRQLTDLSGVVLESGSISLLGQPFLSRFETVTISGGRMTLR